MRSFTSVPILSISLSNFSILFEIFLISFISVLMTGPAFSSTSFLGCSASSVSMTSFILRMFLTYSVWAISPFFFISIAAFNSKYLLNSRISRDRVGIVVRSLSTPCNFFKLLEDQSSSTDTGGGTARLISSRSFFAVSAVFLLS